MENLNSQQFSEAIEGNSDAVVIDVRTPRECAEGVIPGAINIDLFNPNQFKEKLNTLDKSKHYYVYCRSGNRSAQACRYMDGIGFEHTYNLSGGIMEWHKPVEAYQE